jgi:hypothetical protein
MLRLYVKVLTISELNIIPDPSNDVQILGKMTDNSTRTIGGLGLIAEYYDRLGNLVGVEGEAPIKQTLDPGDTSPFKITSYGVDYPTFGNVTLTRVSRE